MTSRIRLGDAITSESPRLQGFLRPDGKALAVNIGPGVAIWRLDPGHLVPAACRLAGRNLTRAEWQTYVGTVQSYRPTCPDLG